MRASGAKAFWLSFFLTLAVVMPLMGFFAWWSVWQDRQAGPVGTAQSGVPVSAGDRTLLAAVAGEEPAFVLMRLSGGDAGLRAVTLPAETVVLDAEGRPVTLGACYAAAGPARAGALLADTLGIRVERYLAATPQVWAAAFEGLGQVRVNPDGILTASAREVLGLSDGAAVLDTAAAAELLAAGELEPVTGARLRAAVWQAFALQGMETLTRQGLDGLRANSGKLLTNLSATDLIELEELLEQLGAGGCVPEFQLLPGAWDSAGRRYELTDDSLRLAREIFQAAQQPEVSPPPEETQEDTE
ncbi:MAG: hypothetical protein IJ484_06010 [Oscillospiraceae bacterium]|nr:hypothetical protein [Oscillospiraceae bacterium]